MREIYRLRDWLMDNKLTAIVTAKTDSQTSEIVNYGFMQFMVDCVIRFDQRLEYGVPAHRLQVTKYRGSNFAPGEFPLSFGRSGIEVAAPEPPEIIHEASTERVSAGFERFDVMLGGGLFRGSSTLITGAPGTSKTTLIGKFAEAACQRGERTLFVSFDEGAEQITRNLSSVGIDLHTHVQSGRLRMYSGRTEARSAEEHLIKLRALIREHQPRCMVIDPLSAMAKAGGIGAARAVANRLIHLMKDSKITVVISALIEGNDPQAEATDLQISTIADTWIHLSYVVRGGERNRALTIVKSRGTWHSNQVRELVLSETGPMLTDVYSAGGEVLMGTLRWEKEAEELAKQQQRRVEFEHKQRELEFAEADTQARIKALELDLQRQQAELALYTLDGEARVLSSSEREHELRRMRGADLALHTDPAVIPPDPVTPRDASGSGTCKKARQEE
jgi:circadian clock protein KaiC